jgi:hypothetical protein
MCDGASTITTLSNGIGLSALFLADYTTRLRYYCDTIVRFNIHNDPERAGPLDAGLEYHVNALTGQERRRKADGEIGGVGR